MIWLDRIMIMVTATPTPEPDKLHKWINSATSNTNVGEVDYGMAGEWLDQGIKWLGDKALDITEPFLIWGNKIIVVSCFLIYYCSGEKKYIGAAIKWAIIFTLFCAIRGAVG